MQLLLKILQERKMQANGAVERGRGLADGMTEREDERPPPGRLTAPMTVSCGATFLVFFIRQRVDVGLLWCFPDGTPGSEPLPSSEIRTFVSSALPSWIPWTSSACWLRVWCLFAAQKRCGCCKLVPDRDDWPGQSASHRAVGPGHRRLRV